MTRYDEYGRRGEEDEYGDIKWETPFQGSLIPAFKLPTFQPVRGGILGMLLGWLLLPLFLLISIAWLTILVEIIAVGVMPYLFFSTNMVGGNFNYHPIIGVAASSLGVYTLIIINCFWLTAYPYSLFSSLNWMVGIFNSTNTTNKMNLDLIFIDPINVFSKILYSLKNGTNGWAICAFISTLLVHIAFHAYINAAYKSLSFRQRRQAFISAIWLAIFLSLTIGGLISLTWK
jgi:hypothetical protein